jgi:DNA polymerase-1
MECSTILENISHSSDFVVVDTETTITDSLGDRELLGVSVSLPDGRIAYFPFDHKSGLDFGDSNLPREYLCKLWDALSEKDLVFHNAKFDLQVMEKFGFKHSGNVACTMIMSHIVDPYPPHGLKELGEERLGIEDSAEMKTLLKKVQKAGLEWHHIPPSIMAPYAANDAYLTRELYNHLMLDFWEYTTPEYFEMEMKFLMVLKEIESRGLLLDRDETASKLNAAVERMRAIQKELGFDPAKRTQLARKLYATPPVGLGLPVYAYGAPSKSFPLGFPTMNDAILSRYSHPVVGLVQEYRRVQKTESTYLRPWWEKSRSDGMLHPTFKPWGTITGRLSCENPNMQQVPRDSYLKELFYAPDGHTLTEFDFDQIEFRLAVAYSKDSQLIGELLSGEDVHSVVAKQLGISRQNAKTVNYAMLYGAGIARMASQLHCSFNDAKTFWENYQNKYSGLARASASATIAAQQRNQIKYWTGRIKPFKSHKEHHKAFNAAIQGGSFEIMKRSMLKLHEAGVPMVNQVHDSVWVNTQTDSERREICELMSSWQTKAFGVPFPVSAKKLGKHGN